METLIVVVVLLLIIGFYFLPFVIADIRHVPHSGSIGTINLLFGWTILGWIAALVWAVAEKPAPPITSSSPSRSAPSSL